MRVKLFANLAEEAGQRDIELAVDGDTTVGEVLDRLFERYPSLREPVLDEDDVPADHINLLVNGSSIQGGRAAMGVSLDDDDELAIFPPVTGGRGSR